LELDFSEKEIAILNAVNGGGKTTILSHIVDAWYEMVRVGYENAFEGMTGKYYRVSGNIHSLYTQQCSLFYIRFINDGQNLDYLDIRGNCSLDEYDKIIKLDNKMAYNTFIEELTSNKHIKKLSDKKNVNIVQIFNNNVITSFPAYRYEEPGYLNDPFQVKTKFSLEFQFSGYFPNPLEVITGLPELANWIMDILLDMLMNQPQVNALINRSKNEGISIPVSVIEPSALYGQINHVFSNALSIKSDSNLSVGIGSRNQGAMRIHVGERDKTGKWMRTVYPSIFNMSSGENAVVTLFGEILRQFDRIKPSNLIYDATGIVLIDEIDKHLHVKLQKEILPKMFNLFPNIQFIISSHSPFVSMGLYDDVANKQRTSVIDLDKGGIEAEPSSTEVFKEAYEAMVTENERFYNLYENLRTKGKTDKLVIVSEGYNGKHICRAISILAPELMDKLDFSFSDKTGWQQLKNAYDAMSNSKQAKYLFVFDCDCPDSVRQLQENEYFFALTFDKRVEDCRAKKGIENLYPDGVLTDDMYDNHKETDGYGAQKDIQTFNKNKLIDQIETDTNPEHFKHFEPLIEKIRLILQSYKVVLPQ